MGSFIENPYVEGALQFDFPAGSGATRYDQWKTHVKVFASVGHKTAVDFLFPLPGSDVLYMTEIKDFHRTDGKGRYKNGSFSRTLCNDVAQKFYDTRAGLADPRKLMTDDERKFAESYASRIRKCVFHWEVKPSFTPYLRKKWLMDMENALSARLHTLKAPMRVKVMNLVDTPSGKRPWEVKRLRQKSGKGT